jgi:hypothetical protein
VSGDLDARDRPALRRGLVAIPFGKAMLVEGGVRRRLLKGTALEQVALAAPRLLPLLDGEHDRDSIIAATGLDPAALGTFLGLLSTCDALEPAGPARSSAGEGPPGHVTTYFARAADMPGGAHELAALLAGSAVVICAPLAIGEQIAADLTETGVGSVIAAERPQAISEPCMRKASSAGAGIAAIFDDPMRGDGGTLAEAVACCRANGLPVLRFASRAALEIGPVFTDDTGVCPACFERGYQAMGWQPDAAQAWTDRPALFDPPASQGMLAGLVTTELLALLTGFGTVTTARGLSRIFAPGHIVERYDVLPEPDCADCGGWQQSDGAIGVVESYEWAERCEPDAKNRRPARQPRQTAATPARARNSASWPRVPLAELSDPGVTHLLRRTAGRRALGTTQTPAPQDPADDDVPLVDTYLVAGDRLPGSSATIFRYDSLSDELVAVRAQPVSLTDALSSTDLDPSGVASAVVLVATFGQMRYRLGTLAPRLCLLEAGSVAAELSASRRGLKISFASCWSWDLASLLDLDPELEIVAAVAAVHHQEPESRECHS